jgi:hypothetical protein
MTQEATLIEAIVSIRTSISCWPSFRASSFSPGASASKALHSEHHGGLQQL